MLYFKNSELTTTYHVALNTVLNWIKASQSGKLDLELVEAKGRTYVANTARNIAALEKLAAERKKYRNTLTTRKVIPSRKFYDVYFDAQWLNKAQLLSCSCIEGSAKVFAEQLLL